MILMHSWRSLQTTFPTRAMEWCFAACLVSLGLVFAINSDAFVTNDAWAGMARFADQTTWSVGCLVIGGLRACALTVNGFWFRTPALRAIMALLSCFIWWQVCYGLFANLGLGAAIMPWFFVFDAYNGIRVGREAGLSEYIHRVKKQAEAKSHGVSAEPAA
jgi:hypothetical protein